MNYRWMDDEVDALERYELFEGPQYRFELDRRSFVQTLGAGLIISLTAAAELQAQRRGSRTAGVSERLHLGGDGLIAVLTGKVEVGQGARTQFLQAAAEELRAPLESLRLIMADFPTVPDDGGTYGSRTTPANIPDVRRACAAARQMLIRKAAETFQANPASLQVADGAVVDRSTGKRFGYGDLARAPNREELEQAIGLDVRLTPVDEWRLLGTPVPRIDGEAIVTGAHRYPSDIRRPGMLYGKILRPPSFGAELREIDLSAARAMEGVVVVRDGNFVGFAAPTSLQADRARSEAARTAQWTQSNRPSSDQVYAHLRSTAAPGRARDHESVREAFRDSQRIIEESYHIAFVQHAPMETRAAVAEWEDDRLTVWTGGQVPTRVWRELANAFRIPTERIRVVIPDTGGAFGGKHTGETAVEAARLARQAKRPVCVQWDREEEFARAYFRPAGVIDMAGALNTENHLLAWAQSTINCGGSAIETPYTVSQVRTETKSAQSPLREGSYRALAATANNFARESFMDELAAAAGEDSLRFRLRHLSEGRLRDVLVAAAEAFGWNEAAQTQGLDRTIGIGLACGTEKGSYVACCAAVEADPKTKRFRVLKVCEAFECGAIQNPANLKAQVEGCVIQGLGPALREEIRFHNAMVTNPRFSSYAVPRISDVPEIETVLVNRTDLPSVGAGETPIIAVAPAIANALFNAVGHRIRSMPIRDDQWRAVNS